MSIGDICMIYRYLYYVKNKSAIPDYEYDILEKYAKLFEPNDHPINNPGSDLEESYSKIIKFQASKILK